MRGLTSLLSGLLVCFLAWCGGFDFDSRGVAAFFVALYSLGAVFIVYTYPGWKEN
jgi:hypothetical protein